MIWKRRWKLNTIATPQSEKTGAATTDNDKNWARRQKQQLLFDWIKTEKNRLIRPKGQQDSICGDGNLESSFQN